jgi:hypothetical protein
MMADAGIDLVKRLKKSKLASLYGRLWDEGLKEAALAEYRALCARQDLSDRMLAGHLLDAILPAVACYRTLTQNVCAGEEALALIRAAVLDAARPAARMFQTMGRLSFFFPLLRIMTPLSVKSGFGEAGWKMQWLKNTRDEIAFTAHSCFYDRVLRQCGVPELTPVFCGCDDYVYGAIPKVRWGRTKTIGRGDAVCDFRFVNERRINLGTKNKIQEGSINAKNTNSHKGQ